MKQFFKAIAFLLLLLLAEQGAVVHELSHFVAGNDASLRTGATVLEAGCTLCPAFAQVATAPFSHDFLVPRLVRVGPQNQVEPQHAAIDASMPRPRSRGPPIDG